MNSKWWFGVVGVVGCFALPAHAQFGDKPAKLSLVKVQDDLYVIHNAYVPGNVTALVTSEGAVLPDFGPEELEAFVAKQGLKP